MHVVVLVGGNPVVLSNRIVGEVRRQLLQRRVILGRGIAGRGIVSAIGAAEENLWIVLGCVVVLVAAVILVGAAGEGAVEAAERNGVLAFRQRSVAGQVDVRIFLIGPPSMAAELQVVAQAVRRRLIGATWGLKRVIVVEDAEVRAG